MSAAGIMIDLRAELGNIIPDVREGSDVQIDGVSPQVIVRPTSADQIESLLRFADQRKFYVVPAGGMTRIRAGAPPEAIDILLDLTALRGTTFYDPGDLTVGFHAGTTIAEVQRTLAVNGQFLPIDVPQPERATIGGVLASAAHGPLKGGYGGVRDFCIGIEFITADGSRVKGGGRVVKNVAGYDLMKLLIGSYGTLGVITAANFKVFPLPKQTRTFIAEFASSGEAIVCRDRIVASPIGNNFMALEIASPRAHEYLAAREVRDPDHYHPSVPIQQTNTWSVYLRASGSDAVLARYQQELGSAVVRSIVGAEERDLWQWMSDFEATACARHQNAMIVHISTPLVEVRTAIEAAEHAAIEHNFIFATIGRISTGNLVCAMLPLSVDPPSAVQFAAAASSLRARLSADSSAVVTACPLESKRHFNVWGGSPTNPHIMRAIKQTLDPNQALNRGRFTPGGLTL